MRDFDLGIQFNINLKKRTYKGMIWKALYMPSIGPAETFKYIFKTTCP